MNNQKTLAKSFSIQGKGLHTGVLVTATFLPAEENYGYKFQRVDLPGKPIIDALAENVIDTRRGTVIGNKEFSISTIEHAMASLYANEIDNCLIEIDGPEMPILDGSAYTVSKKIEEVGITSQFAEKNYYIVRNKMEVSDPASGSKLTLLPDDQMNFNVLIDFNSPILSNQYATLDSLTSFAEEIAGCRTFVFVKELEILIKNNLIKGGDLDNAIVIYDEKMDETQLKNITDLLHQNSINLPNELGYLNKEPLKFPNEPARHKLLDLIGDLALIGRPIKGRVIAYRPGHSINNMLCKSIRKEIKRIEVQPPVYDPNKEPVMDINKIRSYLPHRWPFLLIDKVIEVGRVHIVAIKNVTVNESFFVGHFPQEPVMPGVLLVEAMAQAGGLYVLSTVDEPERYSTYFVKIDNVKFRNKVVPGDTVVFHLTLTGEIRRGIAAMRGYAFVGDKIVTEAEFTAQIIKNK